MHLFACGHIATCHDNFCFSFGQGSSCLFAYSSIGPSDYNDFIRQIFIAFVCTSTKSVSGFKLEWLVFLYYLQKKCKFITKE